MSKVQFSKCPKSFPLQKDITVGEEKKRNQQSCNPVGAFDIHEARNVLTETVNSSIDSEKLLPFNKRKSQYYVWREGDSTLPTSEDSAYIGNEFEGNVKMRSLRSIYKRTKPVADA